MRIPAIADLACSSAVRSLVEPVLGPNCFAVRGILFDKTPSANWKVPWHQDVSIAVKERLEVEGFGPWSIKDGVTHVQPPVAILEQMLTVRLHMDDCFASNGPLRVLPGSHVLAKLSPSQVAALRDSIPAVHCVAPSGSALVMRPLILHASSVATSPAHRRVVHIEYSACELPCGLEWFTSLQPNQ
jgi:ectoine hydroxylase-related dioxygenase (phytanoyl-CoA dioxygenase family)